MLFTNELKIGNSFLNPSGNVTTCISISEILYEPLINPTQGWSDESSKGYKGENCYGIIITPLIMERCGFGIEVAMQNLLCETIYTLEPSTFNSVYGWKLYGREMDLQPICLHVFQNLYHSITGIEINYFYDLT